MNTPVSVRTSAVPPGRPSRSPLAYRAIPLAGVLLLGAGVSGGHADNRLALGRAVTRPRAAAAVPARISVNFKDTAIADVALIISKIAGRDVVLSRELMGTVTASLKDKSVDEVLRAVVTAIGADFLRIGEVYYIAPSAELKVLATRMGERRLVALTRTSPADVASALQARYPYLTVTPQANPRAVLVVGRAEDVEAAERMVQRFEEGFVEPPPPPVVPEPISQEVVRLKHVDAAEVISSLKTIAPELKVQPLGRGRGIVVEGTARNVAFVKSIVETLDQAEAVTPVPIETRIYKVKYVSATTAEKTLKAAVPGLIVTVAPETYSPPAGTLNPISLAMSGNSSGGGSGGSGGGGAFGSGGGGGGGIGGGGGGGIGGGGGQGINGQSPLERASRLVLQGEQTLVDRAIHILKETDVRTQQVEIEARVVEVSPTDVTKLGVARAAGRYVAFADAGGLYGPDENIQLGDMRASYGVGISWISPVGPLRLAYARPVKQFEGDRIQALQFQIGNSF